MIVVPLVIIVLKYVYSRSPLTKLSTTATDVHQHHPVPFVWVGEIASLGDWDALALMPAGIVCITLKEGHHVAVSSAACLTVHCLVCFSFRGGVIETWGFTVLQFVDDSIDFFEGDG